MLAGLREGGFYGETDVHDWTGNDPGIAALLARERNEREAQVVADLIEKRFRDHPKGRIVLTAHSGGTGIAVWALEKLPKDVKVDTVLLLASALSPRYDLTDALAHVRGGMYAFTSELDAFVLGAGTSTFGTIDGVKCDAAGRWGFEMPDDADPKQYEKLVPMPYDAKQWLREGNLGDHIGPMNRRFARNVLAPLVAGGQDVVKRAPQSHAAAPVPQSQGAAPVPQSQGAAPAPTTRAPATATKSQAARTAPQAP
jgi:pimeloyl-ACP methyl ester carboxylesterase